MYLLEVLVLYVSVCHYFYYTLANAYTVHIKYVFNYLLGNKTPSSLPPSFVVSAMPAQYFDHRFGILTSERGRYKIITHFKINRV